LRRSRAAQDCNANEWWGWNPLEEGKQGYDYVVGPFDMLQPLMSPLTRPGKERRDGLSLRERRTISLFKLVHLYY